MDDSLVSALRALPAYVYLADVFRGRRVLEVGCGDGLSAAFLARAGAAAVVGVDRAAPIVEAARARHRAPGLSFVAGDYAALELEDRSFDVICVPGGAELARVLGFLEEARRVLRPGGNVILCAPSGDRAEARGGVTYHELRSRLEPLFGLPRMIGVTPFVGCTLVEFGDDELEEVELDAQLATLGGGREAVTEYVAVAGPLPGGARGYLLVEAPAVEGAQAMLRARAAPPAFEDRRRVRRDDETHALEKRLREVEEEAARAAARAALELDEVKRRAAGEVEQARRRAGEESAARVDDLTARLAARDSELAGLRRETAPLLRSAETHKAELQKHLDALRERDDIIADLQQDVAEYAEAERAAGAVSREAATRANELQTEVRDLRARLSRAEADAKKAAQAAQVPRPDPAAVARVTALETELAEAKAKLPALEALVAEKTAVADKAVVRWKEAEAKNDEMWRKVGEAQKELSAVREQGVETARMQRQAAQIALTRAVDEASRKLVSTQDNLMRTEGQRKELEAEAVALRARVVALEAEREAAREAQAALAKAQSDAARAHADVLAAQGDLSRLRGELVAARRDVVVVREELTSAQRELELSRAARGRLADEFDVVREERGRLGAELEAARAELAVARVAAVSGSTVVAGSASTAEAGSASTVEAGSASTAEAGSASTAEAVSGSTVDSLQSTVSEPDAVARDEAVAQVAAAEPLAAHEAVAQVAAAEPLAAHEPPATPAAPAHEVPHHAEAAPGGDSTIDVSNEGDGTTG